MAVAAAVLLAGGLWNVFLQPAPLDAAVDRVQFAAQQPVTRIYDVEFSIESRAGVFFRRRGRLHTRSTDQFVVRMEELPKRPMTFGMDGQQEWFIVGNRFGLLDDDSTIRPQTMFLEERMYRFMLANELLVSLSDNYTVELLEDSPPPGVQECTAILGRRIDDDRRAPRDVRIWADRKTGVAKYVELTWSNPFRFKPQRVAFRYVGETHVEADFFRLEFQRAASGAAE